MKTFKILTLDGGGIKGLYSASILAELENHFGNSTSSKFDLICGTSTGAIIACALASGLSASTIKDVFEQYGPIIFWKNSWFSKIKQLLLTSKYPDTNLKHTLKKVLKEKTFNDAHNFLCIPSYNVTTGQPYIFKTNHADGLNRDGDIFLWEAALASCSAPTYFPVYKSDYLTGHKFVDGGVWANNPALVALVEAKRYFVGEDKEFDNTILVSISNLDEVFSKFDIRPWRNSVLGWNTGLIKLFLSAQIKSVENIMDHLTEALDVNYLRIKLPELSPELIHKLDFDNADNEVMESIIAHGINTGQKIKNAKTIKSVYQT